MFVSLFFFFDIHTSLQLRKCLLLVAVKRQGVLSIYVWSGSTNFLNMHLASLTSICQRLLFWCAQAHPVLQVPPDEKLVFFEESPPRTDEDALT